MCKKGFKDNIVTAVRAIAKMVSERRVMTYAAAADYHELEQSLLKLMKTRPAT